MRVKIRHTRPGFTMVELLLVITIIAVLAALLLAAVMRFANVGPAGATRANFGKIRILMANQWKAVLDQVQTENKGLAGNSNYLQQASQNMGNAPASQQRVKDEYVRLKLIQAFPTRFDEVFWPHPGWKPGTPQATAPNAYQPYVQYLAAVGIKPDNEAVWGLTGTSPVSLDVQCAVCLLMILEKGPRNAGATADDLGRTAVGSLALGTSGQNAPGVVDGWGNAVLFTRTYNNQPNRLAFVSAGRDGQFGLDLTTFAVTSAPDADDNVVVEVP